MMTFWPKQEQNFKKISLQKWTIIISACVYACENFNYQTFTFGAFSFHPLIYLNLWPVFSCLISKMSQKHWYKNAEILRYKHWLNWIFRKCGGRYFVWRSAALLSYFKLRVRNWSKKRMWWWNRGSDISGLKKQSTHPKGGNTKLPSLHNADRRTNERKNVNITRNVYVIDENQQSSKFRVSFRVWERGYRTCVKQFFYYFW